MAKSDSLYQLINSLSSSEKRYFKLFSSQLAGGKDKNYLTLFDAIDQASEEEIYGESNKKKKYKEGIIQAKTTIPTKHFASYKAQLYNQILRSLRVYHSNKSVEIKLRALLLDIQILIEKNLYRQAQKRIIRAKELAKEYHYEFARLELILLERKLTRRIQQNDALNRIEILRKENEMIWREINHQLKMLEVYEPFHLGLRHQYVDAITVEKYAEKINQLIQEFEQDPALLGNFSFNTLCDFYKMSFNYYHYKKDYDKKHDMLQKYIMLYEEDEKMIKEKPENYVRGLYNYINGCFNREKYNEVFSCLRKMQRIGQEKSVGGYGVKDYYINLQIFQHTHAIQCKYYILTKQYQKAASLIPSIENGLKLYEKDISVAWLIPFYHNISGGLFLQGNYSETLTWVNKIILLENTKEVQLGTQLLSRILQIVSHYELENYGLVAENLVPSTINYLKKIEQRKLLPHLTPDLKEFVRGIRKACFAVKQKRIKIFKKLYQDFSVKWNTREMSEILSWIKHKSFEH